MLEVWERPPLNVKTSCGGPLGGDARGLGEPTNYLEDINGGPSGRRCWSPGVPQPALKTSMVGPLVDDARAPGALTTYLEDVDGGPPGR
jgi:hypothetical protein